MRIGVDDQAFTALLACAHQAAPHQLFANALCHEGRIDKQSIKAKCLCINTYESSIAQKTIMAFHHPFFSGFQRAGFLRIGFEETVVPGIGPSGKFLDVRKGRIIRGQRRPQASH